MRVYCGQASACSVASGTIASAYVDTSSEPAIIFRIAARNAKGYGPALQVRLLQGYFNGLSFSRPQNEAIKRPLETLPNAQLKRSRP